MTGRAHILSSKRADPLLLVWPVPGRPAALVRFEKAVYWRRFTDGRAIDAPIPESVQTTFARAKTLFLLGWIDVSLVKACGFATLVALELALIDRYDDLTPKRKRSSATLLAYIVEADALSDANISP